MSNNLALNKNAYASDFISPFEARRAIDGNMSPIQRWVSAKMPCWMTVDLGDTYWIEKWVVKHMGASGWSSPNYNMKNYKFNGSLDNANWFKMDTVTNNTASITNRTISLTQTRYVQVYVSGGLNINNDVASIVELEVYGTQSILTDLILKAGRSTIALNPEFNPITFQYTANASNITALTVTPTAQSDNAEITVNGQNVINGQPSSSINLNIGQNIIRVIVASDNDQRTYTVNVTREG